MSPPLRTVRRRPLGRGPAAIAAMLVMSIIAGLVNALAIMAGLQQQWAFAVGWLSGFTALIVRQAIRAGQNRSAWRAGLAHVVLMSVITLVVTWLFGARIFAAAD